MKVPGAPAPVPVPSSRWRQGWLHSERWGHTRKTQMKNERLRNDQRQKRGLRRRRLQYVLVALVASVSLLYAACASTLLVRSVAPSQIGSDHWYRRVPKSGAFYGYNITQPFVMLHAGPHKTGTTSLQSFVAQRSTQSWLWKDGLAIPSAQTQPRRDDSKDDRGGGVDEETSKTFWKFAHCSRIAGTNAESGEFSPSRCAASVRSYRTSLVDLHASGKHLLVISEDYDHPDLDMETMMQRFRPFTNVKVTLTYRRLHEWLLSWYGEIVYLHRQAYVDAAVRSNGGGGGDGSANSVGVDDAFPTFVEWLPKNYEEFASRHAVPLYRRFASHFPEVQLMNLHEFDSRNDGGGAERGAAIDGQGHNKTSGGNNLLHEYYCNILNASQTCTALSSDIAEFGGRKLNPQKSMEYVRIVLHAHRRGLLPHVLPHQLGRMYRTLGKKVEGRLRGMEAAGDDLPRRCLPTALVERMFRDTLEAERSFPQLRDWHVRRGGEEGLRRELDIAAKTTLCSLDVDKLLDMRELQGYLSQLRP